MQLSNFGVAKKFLRQASLVIQLRSEALPPLCASIELTHLGRGRGEHCHPSAISGVEAALFCKRSHCLIIL